MITDHAMLRMGQRGIKLEVLELILRFGREIRSKGAVFYVLGKKEVQKYCQYVPQLKEMEGMQVLTSNEGVVITAYRNKNLRKVRPSLRKYSYSH